MWVVSFMVALLIKLCTVESPAKKKAKQKQYDADPNCCLKSLEWNKEHPEGYFEWYDKYIREVHKEFNKLSDAEKKIYIDKEYHKYH